jgi:hypothetical protein
MIAAVEHTKQCGGLGDQPSYRSFFIPRYPSITPLVIVAILLSPPIHPYVLQNWRASVHMLGRVVSLWLSGAPETWGPVQPLHPLPNWTTPYRGLQIDSQWQAL